MVSTSPKWNIQILDSLCSLFNKTLHSTCTCLVRYPSCDAVILPDSCHYLWCNKLNRLCQLGKQLEKCYLLVFDLECVNMAEANEKYAFQLILISISDIGYLGTVVGSN